MYVLGYVVVHVCTYAGMHVRIYPRATLTKPD